MGFVGTLLSRLRSGSRTPVADAVLDYDQLIPLDAEDLAEQGIGAAYVRLLPLLRQHVATPAAVHDLIDAETPSYGVRCADEDYLVYGPAMPGSDRESWGRATCIFFRIVNAQLDQAIRFYAIGGGNDLGGMFLTAETAKRACSMLSRKSDWPYIPQFDPPWYGQPNQTG
jgi:hypothetical protein